MGTFILRPVSVSVANTGWEVIIGSNVILVPTDPELVEAAISTDDPMNITGLRITGIGNGAVSFSCIGLGLFLDGSLTPIDTANLPAGFTVVSANLIGTTVFNATGGGKQIEFLRDGSTLHTSLGSESVSVALSMPMTNPQLINSVLRIIGTDPDGVNIAANNFGIEGVYINQSFTITLNPPNGNVESGQQIAVSSPDVDVQALTYAAIQNDKVIPLKISPEGNLTIPDPAPDPCTDCLGDCPNCDDCVTACQDDLNSEACQECLQSCLDCLADCLENLEQAEECQDSTQDPPGAVPIEIVCSDGTQFNGSVTLGTFTILLTQGSGIYRFIPGQTKDVLYSSSRDGSTYDVKIPNPFAKTGFFRS